VADPSIFGNVCYMSNVTARFSRRLIVPYWRVQRRSKRTDSAPIEYRDDAFDNLHSETSHYRARDQRDSRVKPCSIRKFSPEYRVRLVELYLSVASLTISFSDSLLLFANSFRNVQLCSRKLLPQLRLVSASNPRFASSLQISFRFSLSLSLSLSLEIFLWIHRPSRFEIQIDWQSQAT